MFLGTYQTGFSGKNRAILPKKLRVELAAKELVLTQGMDGCIWGFRIKDWEIEAQSQLGISVTEERGRHLRRIFFSQAERVELDEQGRFILPTPLLEFAGIKQTVLMIGAGDHFEIWNPQKWEAQIKSYG